MQFQKKVKLKNGKSCFLRSGTAADGEAVLSVFLRTHAETDFLLSYPEENHMDAEAEGRMLQEREESDNALFLLALVDGVLAGTAGINPVGEREKLRHRAEFGIGIEKEFWGQGVGRALTEACIQSAREAGYVQLELSVVEGNDRALALYESLGFREYGRNPRGFRLRTGEYQTLIDMRLEL